MILSDTSAKVVGKSKQSDEDNVPDKVSSLRRKAAISLADTDKKYAGKRISRKKLSPEWDIPAGNIILGSNVILKKPV